MKLTQIVLLFVCLSSYGQNQRYRFDAGVGLHTRKYWNQSFERILANGYDYKSVYNTEYYDLDYSKNGFSLGFNFSLSINWINKKHFILKQRNSLSFEIYTDVVKFTLVDFGDGSLNDSSEYQPSEVPLEYTNTATFNGLIGVFRSELIGLWVSTKDIQLGGGLSYTYWGVRDEPAFSDGYIPWGVPRGTPVYITHQLGISIHSEKRFDWWSIFVNINQNFLTLKKNKGSIFFQDDVEIVPVSHNLDFRFPMTIQIGANINFGKIKK